MRPLGFTYEAYALSYHVALLALIQSELPCEALCRIYSTKNSPLVGRQGVYLGQQEDPGLRHESRDRIVASS